MLLFVNRNLIFRMFQEYFRIVTLFMIFLTIFLRFCYTGDKVSSAGGAKEESVEVPSLAVGEHDMCLYNILYIYIYIYMYM